MADTRRFVLAALTWALPALAVAQTAAPAADKAKPQSLPAVHQTTTVDWLTCSSSDVKLIDERIKSCTIVIKFGQESKDRTAMAHYRRGTAYDLKREIDRAIADFDEAIKLDPSLAAAYNDRGNARLVKGDADGAMADYEAAIRLDPTDEDAFNNRGRALFNRGQYDKALTDLDKAIDLDPKFVRAYRNRGMTRFALGRFDDAAKDFHESVRLQPFDGYSLLWQHIAEARAGREEKSDLHRYGNKLDPAAWPGPIIKVYRGESTAVAVRLAAAQPDQKCDAAFYMGELDLLNGRMGSARSLLEQAVDICPKDFTEHSAALIELKRTKP
jgi:lipoprotein NlpI